MVELEIQAVNPLKLLWNLCTLQSYRL